MQCDCVWVHRPTVCADSAGCAFVPPDILGQSNPGTHCEPKPKWTRSLHSPTARTFPWPPAVATANTALLWRRVIVINLLHGPARLCRVCLPVKLAMKGLAAGGGCQYGPTGGADPSDTVLMALKCPDSVRKWCRKSATLRRTCARQRSSSCAPLPSPLPRCAKARCSSAWDYHNSLWFCWCRGRETS